MSAPTPTQPMLVDTAQKVDGEDKGIEELRK